MKEVTDKRLVDVVKLFSDAFTTCSPPRQKRWVAREASTTNLQIAKGTCVRG